MKLLSRSWVDEPLDRLRFRLDAFPGLDYQPLPWLGIGNARRTAGSESRLQAILPVLSEVNARSALDIGANVGWFTINLALRGIATVAVESCPKYYRTALYALQKLRLSNAALLVLTIDRQRVSMVPPADCVLFLSVWHHIVRNDGFEDATAVLTELWRRSARVLFFETGEQEIPASWGLPAMEPDPCTWLRTYLADTCDGAARVDYLGAHEAFAPDGARCRRDLFAVVRRLESP